VSHQPTSKHHRTRLGSVPNRTVKQSAVLTRDKSLHIIFERHKLQSASRYVSETGC